MWIGPHTSAKTLALPASGEEFTCKITGRNLLNVKTIGLRGEAAGSGSDVAVEGEVSAKGDATSGSVVFKLAELRALKPGNYSFVWTAKGGGAEETLEDSNVTAAAPTIASIEVKESKGDDTIFSVKGKGLDHVEKLGLLTAAEAAVAGGVPKIFATLSDSKDESMTATLTTKGLAPGTYTWAVSTDGSNYQATTRTLTLPIQAKPAASVTTPQHTAPKRKIKPRPTHPRGTGH